MKTIKYFFLFTIYNCICIFSYCQQFNRDLNIKSIKSIDWTEFDYSQLKFFEEILKEKNVLILSEADHGDGSSFDARCMIMKGLIDSSKINIVYTESSWMVLDKINDILKEEGTEGINKTIGYMQSVELKYWVSNGFWNYLANKIIEGKVVLKGFDVGTSRAIAMELFNEAINLKPVKAYIQSNPKDFEEIRFSYENFDGWQVASIFDEEGYKQEKNFIDSVTAGYETTKNSYRIKQWQTILDFFYWMYKRTLLLKGNKYVNVPKGDRQESAFMSVRDSLMASYFLQNYNSNKNIKAVALMSSYHAMHNFNSIEGLNDCCIGPTVNIIGEILYKKMGKEIYNMCFITSSGFRGINYYFTKKVLRKIPKPELNSIEYSLKNLPNAYAIIDFESSSLKDSSFYMSPVFYRNLKSNWSKNFSGIFFIKKMEPIVLGNEQLQKIE